jgi:hypothetical protein
VVKDVPGADATIDDAPPLNPLALLPGTPGPGTPTLVVPPAPTVTVYVILGVNVMVPVRNPPAPPPPLPLDVVELVGVPLEPPEPPPPATIRYETTYGADCTVKLTVATTVDICPLLSLTEKVILFGP